MKLNTILHVFAPKDPRFFPLLKDSAVILDQAATLLLKLFSSPDKSLWKALCVDIKAEEVKGDRSTGLIFKELNHTFITPFDREDISALADEIDDVIDAINRSAQKVLLYSPEALPEATMQLAEIIKLGTAEILNAVDKLSGFKKYHNHVRAHTKEIKRLEEKADVVYEEGISRLFKEETNPTELIKLKEIIQELEKSANRINNVGKTLKTIVVKYS
jgi:predicted phosphate transport protein (TIGR00153 family)